LKKAFAILTVLVLVSVMAISATTLENVIKRGKLIVATDLTAIPMQYRDAQGNPTGFVVEMMNLAAQNLGVELEWRDMAWESLIPSLTSRKVDMIAANMSMLLTRAKSIRFSDPYFLTGVKMLVRADTEVENWEEFKDPKLKLGETMGSSHADWIEANWNRDVSLYDNMAEWVTELKNGRIDGVMDDEMLVLDIVKREPSLKALPGYIRVDMYGLAFNQGTDDDSIVDWFNLFLKWIKLTGEYGEIYENYVGAEWQPSWVID